MAIYHEDIMDIELESGTIARNRLCKAIGEGDTMANRYGVRIFRNGDPVTVENRTVSGIFISPNGNAYAITETNYSGSTGKDGNKAWVQLPGICYETEGPFTLVIKLSGSGINGTMRIIDGVVAYTGENGAVVPTSSIPSTADLIAAYEEAIAVISNSVRYDVAQDMTAAEQAQVRENIEGQIDIGLYIDNGGYICQRISSDT